MNLREYNQIQIELMLDSSIEPTLWVREYSQKFRVLYEKGVSKIEEFKRALYS